VSATAGSFQRYAILAPPFAAEDARRVAAECYGIRGEVVELASYQDRNFLITAPDGGRAVLKVANPHFGRPSLELQNAAMAHVAGAGLPFATPVCLPALDGREIISVELAGAGRDVRLVSHLSGTPLSEVRHHAGAVRVAVGALAGRIARTLADFEHPAAERVLQWDVRHAGAVVDGLLRYVSSAPRRTLVERAMAVHDTGLAGVRDELRLQVIHGDVTRYNVLGQRDRAGRLQPGALIDFGDVVRTYLSAELATALADVAGGSEDPLRALAELTAGFYAESPLTESELAAVFPLTLGRAAASAVAGAQQASLESGNRYVGQSADASWARLAALEAVPPALAEAVCRSACGLEPHPGGPALRRFLASASPARLVDPGGRRPVPVDLGAGSETLREGGWRTAEGLDAAVARPSGELAVGRWGEGRIASGEPAGGAEPATVHLGIDVFAAEGEPVRAPLAGVVERRGAAELLLRHEPPGGPRFWTRLAGVDPHRQEGEAVERAAPVGVIGAATGKLPAHLHAQLALAQLERLPGHGRPSLRAAWLGLCPDPSALMGIDAAAPYSDPDGVLARRRRVVARAQRVFFARPPEIVRGWRQHLYDADGRAYLDMINNVAVVGHSHPRVAEAASRQLRLLNTNSRFLYESLVRYAERLAELVPAPLGTVFMVNSGSEANDLALRLARSFTGQSAVIALEGAYHGWTSATAEIGTSTYDVAGAEAPPSPWVRAVPAPDPYRGAHGADDPAAGARYAEAVRVAAPGAAAFICEPQLGNAGGVLLPPGYLQAAYAHVRAAGGVCIADEVQVGYGRLGRWFWAFEEQRAVPDIVTIAKPAGNGHPLGAVITTPEIAGALRPRTSLFSSPGGSPVSCAIGLAVLDVLRDEKLQDNARLIGDQLRTGLEQLMSRHALIGAVHGAGLHLGVELVRDRATKEPASDEAYALCERMLELGVIVQPTGELANVLKVKPPLCVGARDADTFLHALDRVLGDGW
jgi:4-aminobutyrate aminotransferase-like enzyme/Ser/Thr protein kinase RdoA (MazF antagonist)